MRVIRLDAYPIVREVVLPLMVIVAGNNGGKKRAGTRMRTWRVL